MGREEKNKEGKTDLILLILVLLLVATGMVMLFSTSEYNGRVRFGDSAYYFKKQLFATSLGLLVMYGVARTDYHFFIRLAPFSYLLAMGLSTAVLLVGQEINGSKRWLNFGPLSFQPSEFAKVAVILFLAWQIYRTQSKNTGIWFMCRTMLTLLPIVGLVGSNNLSTAIIILGIGAVLIFVSNPRYAPFLGMGAIAWNVWPSGGTRRNMKKVFRPYRGFMLLEAAGFLEEDWEAACKSWDLCRKPRMI